LNVYVRLSVFLIVKVIHQNENAVERSG
jgi:hypothetical protein